MSRLIAIYSDVLYSMLLWSTMFLIQLLSVMCQCHIFITHIIKARISKILQINRAGLCFFVSLGLLCSFFILAWAVISRAVHAQSFQSESRALHSTGKQAVTKYHLKINPFGIYPSLCFLVHRHILTSTSEESQHFARKWNIQRHICHIQRHDVSVGDRKCNHHSLRCYILCRNLIVL